MTIGTRHLFGLLISLLLLSSQVRAGGAGEHPTPLACPTQHVTWLQGTATPGQAVLVRFAGAVVGGGRVTAAGQWRIPLTVDAPTGIYPVTVVERTSSDEIAAFTCYVDLPVGATPTGTPTRQPTTPHPSATTTPRPTDTPTLTATPTAPTRTATPPSPASPTESSMPTATVPHIDTTPTTAPTPSPMPSVPAASAQPAVVLVMVYADDPDDPELFEYVILENRSAAVQALTGWRLIHQPTGERYTFPVVTLPAGEQLVVWSGAGLDDPALGTLFWLASTGRWNVGDSAELATPDGQVVSTLQVSLPSADEE